MSNKNKDHNDRLIMPSLQFRFRVIFDQDLNRHITNQVVSLSLDYTTKTCKLIVRQPYTPDVHDAILALTECYANHMTVEHLNSEADITHSLVFSGCKVTSHSYNLSYSSSDCAQHVIQIQYQTVKTSSTELAKE